MLRLLGAFQAPKYSVSVSTHDHWQLRLCRVSHVSAAQCKTLLMGAEQVELHTLRRLAEWGIAISSRAPLNCCSRLPSLHSRGASGTQLRQHSLHARGVGHASVDSQTYTSAMQWQRDMCWSVQTSSMWFKRSGYRAIA